MREFGKEKFEAELRSARPLSEFLLNTLSTRVDMRTAEGRAHFLQDAKPLVKQITAPMFSLIVRQELAKLGGLSLHELDTRFEIQSVSRPAARPRARGNTPPSIVRRLNELLLIRPELVQSADARNAGTNSDCSACPTFLRRNWNSSRHYCGLSRE